MEEHEDKAMRQHLRMMISMIQLKPNQEPPAVISATAKLVNLPPVKFTISDFTNWREDKQNFQEVIDFNSASNLVSKKGTRSSPVINKFVPHSLLSCNSTTNTEYLQNDCVRLRVSKLILYSTALLNKTPNVGGV